VFQLSQEGTLETLDAKAKDGKKYFKVRQLEDPAAEKKDEKSIRQIRIRHLDLNSGYHDPFLRYWIKIYDLSETARDPTYPGYLAQLFVDTEANCNTISRALFEQLIDRISIRVRKGAGIGR